MKDRPSFDDMLAGSEYPDQIRYQGSPLVKLRDDEDSGPCWHCGAATRWVDLCFEIPLCSPDCSDAKWEEFYEAAQQHRGSEQEVPF